MDLIEDCIKNVRKNAPDAQSLLAPRFSVGVKIPKYRYGVS